MDIVKQKQKEERKNETLNKWKEYRNLIPPNIFFYYMSIRGTDRVHYFSLRILCTKHPGLEAEVN